MMVRQTDAFITYVREVDCHITSDRIVNTLYICEIYITFVLLQKMSISVHSDLYLYNICLEL